MYMFVFYYSAVFTAPCTFGACEGRHNGRMQNTRTKEVVSLTNNDLSETAQILKHLIALTETI